MGGVPMHGIDGIPNDGERPIPQQIDFDETGILGAVLLELNHGNPKIRVAFERFDGRLYRNKIGERGGRDHHSTRMHR
jgi:hypothetical protein